MGYFAEAEAGGFEDVHLLRMKSRFLAFGGGGGALLGILVHNCVRMGGLSSGVLESFCGWVGVISDGHDQIMIEFCSTIAYSITSIIGIPRSDHDRVEHP